MTRSAKALGLLTALLVATSALAAPDTAICRESSRMFSVKKYAGLPDPSRKPTRSERLLIGKSAIELLASTDYQMGSYIVDADNDGKDDVFAWNITGSGRVVVGELLDVSTSRIDGTKSLVPKASLELGVLQVPRFVRFRGVNYLVHSDSGDESGIRVSRVAKVAGGGFELRTLCQTKTVLKVVTDCGHAACKELKAIAEDGSRNGQFVRLERPHAYSPPAGPEIYFSDEGSSGDFDNTGQSTLIWRIGRDGYVNHHIYWTLLGQGDQMPKVAPELRPSSDGELGRRVLPGAQHDRLRQVLSQHSEVLSRKLGRKVSLPGEAQFFLFTDNEQKTYWAWDLTHSYGAELHILYTDANRSNYIGRFQIKRNLLLERCSSDCIVSLAR